MARRIEVAAGRAAVGEWLSRVGDTHLTASGEPPTVNVPRSVVATAVRYTLEEFGDRHPGHSVEVRVPPFGVVQCIEGTHHRRGVPPAVVEMGAISWLALVTGRATWDAEITAGRVAASGERADLGDKLPMWPPAG